MVDLIRGFHQSLIHILFCLIHVEISPTSEQFLVVVHPGVPYYLLNAKPENASREAEIIAAGGRLGAVTISTNMAGRGTDIVLGGDAKSMAKLHLQAALVEAFGCKDASVSLALCLDLPEEVEEEMSHAASAVLQSNPSAQLEAVMAAVCDGIEDPQALTIEAYRDSLHALQTVYSKAGMIYGLHLGESGESLSMYVGLSDNGYPKFPYSIFHS